MFEGFYTTQRGREHFAMNLRQISDAVVTTCQFGAMRALLSCHDYYKAYRAEHGPIRLKYADLSRTERNRWAILMKDQKGLYHLDAQIRHDFRKAGHPDPNLIVLPDGTSMYVRMNEYHTTYNQHGPGNITNLTRGEDTMLTFNGTRVEESGMFDLDFVGENCDLTLREEQCGTYWILEENEPGLFIYSADADDFVWLARDKIKTWENTDSNGPSEAATGRVVIFRPFERYLMGSALFMVGGRELGVTLHGHENMMLSDDVARKIHIGHFTFLHKSIVKNDRLITIAENVISKGYLGGAGHAFIDKNDVQNIQAGNWDLVNGSLIAFKNAGKNAGTDFNKDGTISNPLSIRGPDGLDGEPYAARYEKPDGRVDGYEVLDYMGLDNGVLPPSRGANERFLTDVRSVNSVCYRGMQLDGRKRIVSLATGHWGNPYPGCLAVRNGEQAYLKDMNYSDKMVNVSNNAPELNATKLTAVDTVVRTAPGMTSAVDVSNISSSAASRRKKKPGV